MLMDLSINMAFIVQLIKIDEVFVLFMQILPDHMREKFNTR